MKTGMKRRGSYVLEHYGKDGKLKRVIRGNNGIVNVGKNKLLDVMFGAVAQITAWFVGLIQDGGFSILADSDTMASHGGWTEFTGYDEATRVAWDEDAAANEQITNTTKAEFTINTPDTLKGLFITSDSAKSGVAGTLWATALWDDGDLVVVALDTIKITYTLST